MYNHYLTKCFEVSKKRGLEDEKTIAIFQLLELYEKTKSKELEPLLDKAYEECMK